MEPPTPAEQVRKAFKYKLKPTSHQERALERVLHRCRTLYNTAIEERKTAWEQRSVALDYYEQKAELPDLKRECPEFAEVHAQVLQDVLLRLDRAFQAFFRRIKAGQTPGYPRFQGRNRYHSFTYPQVGKHGGARVDNGFLVLSRIGRIAVRWSRPLEGIPKTVTISREADGWYAAISCAEVPMQPLPATGQDTGIDLGLESFATLANGERIFNPGWYRKAERRLRHLQRTVSRRIKGSHRRRKAVALLAKAHLKVRRQRQDFHHKRACELLQQYDTIYHEDLRPANMVKNHHLAKSIADAGWSQFVSILAFKAACAGKRVVAVPPAYTSQVCSGCGVIVQKSLSVRWHFCPQCGTSLHRDHNAALNILRLGHEHERDKGPGMALQGAVAVAAAAN